MSTHKLIVDQFITLAKQRQNVKTARIRNIQICAVQMNELILMHISGDIFDQQRSRRKELRTNAKLDIFVNLFISLGICNSLALYKNSV